jgi:hypothetical protein
MEIAPMSANEWVMAIMEASRQKIDVVPAEFKTRQQIGKELKRSVSQTGKIIKNLIECGAAESKYFRIQVTNGVHPIRHYKIIK